MVIWNTIRLTTLAGVLATSFAGAQSILHYTETSGFDHQTRVGSLAMFQDIATDLGASVVDDADGNSFNTLAGLQQFDAIIFSNTSGDAILDPLQRTNFEAYIAGGGSVLGIHAASDTYRHSTANGSNTGVWDFYAELLGASVQQAPNHVTGTPLYDLFHEGTHPSTANLPDPWSKEEEYYYWESGYYRAENIAVLMVEETVGPNGLVNSYDAPRPMSWYRDLPDGGRVFYTALGHAASNFTGDALFKAHIRDAMDWILGTQTSLAPAERTATLHIHPVPSNDQVMVDWLAPPTMVYRLRLVNAQGRSMTERNMAGDRCALDLCHLPEGFYTILVAGDGWLGVEKLIIAR